MEKTITVTINTKRLHILYENPELSLFVDPDHIWLYWDYGGRNDGDVFILDYDKIIKMLSNYYGHTVVPHEFDEYDAWVFEYNTAKRKWSIL